MNSDVGLIGRLYWSAATSGTVQAIAAFALFPSVVGPGMPAAPVGSTQPPGLASVASKLLTTGLPPFLAPG